MDESEQHGGGIKKEETNVENTELKKEDTEPSGKGEKRKADDGDMSELLDDGMDQFLVERARRLQMQGNPLFRANLLFMPYKRHALKGDVKKEQFTVTFEQLRQPKHEESLGEGMSESLFEAIRDNILQQQLDERTKVHLTLTSKEHANGTVQSGPYSDAKYGIPVNEFLKRSDYVHTLFESLGRKINSAQI